MTQAAPKHPQKANVVSAASNSDTLVDSGVSVYTIHIDYEEEWLQHTLLWESNIGVVTAHTLVGVQHP